MELNSSHQCHLENNKLAHGHDPDIRLNIRLGSIYSKEDGNPDNMDIRPDMDYTKMLTTYSPCILMIAISFNAIILISLSEVQPNEYQNRIFGTTNICMKYKAHNIKRIRSYSQVAHYFRRRTSYNNNDLTGYSARYSAGYSARYRDHTHSFSRWH